VDADRQALRNRLREAGLSDPLINAAWPAWWSDDAFASQSAKAELRFAIARKLGLSPESLFHDDVKFLWRDDARFKNLSNETDDEKSILTSFGISVCRILVQSIRSESQQTRIRALELRASILQSRSFIDLQGLLAACWAIGVPVVHLRVFPLDAKRMHAMAVRVAGRHAILLGRDANYPAPVAFTLAHEIGHVMLGHVESSTAIVDVGDPLDQPQGDSEESEADQYALQLLLGTSEPQIHTNVQEFNARQLANAVLQHGPALQIEPGTLALCLAHQRGLWPIANAAMQHIYSVQKPVWQEVNRIAALQLDPTAVGDDSAIYLDRVMGIGDE
jgi:Zn-dependent peptidase ImmA (M78 family)